MTTCEFADNLEAYKCQTEEQCDNCFMIDHLKECNGCNHYDHPETVSELEVKGDIAAEREAEDKEY